MKSEYHNSFIHDLQIATPCKANWDEMVGDDCKRHCSLCNLNVYNLSAMTLEEAEQLIITAEGRVCLRMFRRNDGTVITRDCPVGLAEKLKRRLAMSFAGVASIFAVILGWMHLSTPTAAKHQAVGGAEMGKQRVSPASMSGAVHPIEIKGDVAIPAYSEMKPRKK